MRAVLLLLALAGPPCAALTLVREPPDAPAAVSPDAPAPEASGSQLGQTSSATTVKVAGELTKDELLGGDGQWFGAEAAAAEAKAKELEAAAQVAAQKAGDGPNERQIGALDARAVAEVKKESVTEGQLQNVAGALMKEGAAAERVAANMERKQRQEELAEERQLAQLDKEIKKLKKGESAEASVEDWKKHAQKAENIARARQREEEKNEAHQHWLANKELRESEKLIQAEREAKRAYRREQRSLELATTSRIWQEADALREAAANSSFLPREEVLRLLDIPDEKLSDMEVTIDRLARDAEVFQRHPNAILLERVEGIRLKAVGAAAAMEEAIRHHAEDFLNISNISNEYDDKQYVMRLSWLISEIKDEIKELYSKTSGIGKRMDSWNLRDPEKLTMALSLALDGVTENVEFRNKFYNIDTPRLAYANATEACVQLASMVEGNLQPALTSLQRMKDILDRMSQVVPSALKDQPPRCGRMMVNGTHALLNMAYAQHLAFKDSTTILMKELVPAVQQRFQCQTSGAAGLGFGGLAAALLAVAASWLSL